MRILYYICFLGFGAGVIASTNEVAKITKEEAVKAIVEFRKNPLTEEGRFAAGRIISFAEQSDDVSIHIAQPLVPWLHDGTDEKYRSLLLGAYIAGNVKSQLDHGIQRDDPHAGMLVVFEVYHQMKEADKKCRIPEIEEFMKLETEHQLEARLRRLLQDELKKPDAAPAVQPIRAEGAYFHSFSHFSFPTNVGGAIRVSIDKYDAEGLDVSAEYNLLKTPMKITVYVYPAMENGAAKAVISNHFEYVKTNVKTVHPAAKTLSEGTFDLTLGNRSQTGRHAVFNYEERLAGIEQPVQSELYLFLFEPDASLPIDNHRFFVMYRMTYRTAEKDSAEKEAQHFLKDFAWPMKK
jgi:hypothetical protein